MGHKQAYFGALNFSWSILFKVTELVSGGARKESSYSHFAIGLTQ